MRSIFKLKYLALCVLPNQQGRSRTTEWASSNDAQVFLIWNASHLLRKTKRSSDQASHSTETIGTTKERVIFNSLGQTSKPCIYEVQRSNTSFSIPICEHTFEIILRWFIWSRVGPRNSKWQDWIYSYFVVFIHGHSSTTRWNWGRVNDVHSNLAS